MSSSNRSAWHEPQKKFENSQQRGNVTLYLSRETHEHVGAPRVTRRGGTAPVHKIVQIPGPCALPIRLVLLRCAAQGLGSIHPLRKETETEKPRECEGELARDWIRSNGDRGPSRLMA